MHGEELASPGLFLEALTTLLLCGLYLSLESVKRQILQLQSLASCFGLGPSTGSRIKADLVPSVPAAVVIALRVSGKPWEMGSSWGEAAPSPFLCYSWEGRDSLISPSLFQNFVGLLNTLTRSEKRTGDMEGVGSWP